MDRRIREREALVLRGRLELLCDLLDRRLKFSYRNGCIAEKLTFRIEHLRAGALYVFSGVEVTHETGPRVSPDRFRMAEQVLKCHFVAQYLTGESGHKPIAGVVT